MGAMVSVCMATCNGSRYIRAQLESILEQLGPEDELIISDDASTDDTLDIVGSYGDPRIIILSGTEFPSPVRNFEQALRHARGGIVVLRGGAARDDEMGGQGGAALAQPGA